MILLTMQQPPMMLPIFSDKTELRVPLMQLAAAVLLLRAEGAQIQPATGQWRPNRAHTSAGMQNFALNCLQPLSSWQSTLALRFTS